MVEQLTPRQFHDAEGVGDWRALGYGVHAHFRTRSFVRGVSLVERIGVLADAANHHPDVDLRYGAVTVSLVTHEVNGLTKRDIDLARQISEAARELGIPAEPAAVSNIQVTIDALDIPKVREFWRALLAYREVGDEGLVDPYTRGPSFCFQQMGTARAQRNRAHVDLFVPHDSAESRVQAALAAGGRMVADDHAPSWWVLADPEGNEACIASWLGRH
ncbi:MAG TPA: VOC family protein [Acidimicrobiales bacterium]|nr:VOC family protein [Acidimicrobiales bacterium]